ncbi:phage tail tube protein [Sphingobium sp. CFD-2]|uniref:phage tail tube protein n=1 Tax=Sphingobium sp. CFD-2 TaxID=2878542 RepID=UPI00214B1042|nr:phage tail tube protein [Sphingobium sp. CFD-2]
MAIKSQGTTVHISNEDADATAYGSATFAKVGEVDNVGEPSGEAADIDVTHLESEAKEYLIGLPDNGNIAISGNFVPDDTGQLELRDAKDVQERRWLKITWSSGDVWYIKALVKKYAASAAVDGKTPFSSSFRTSGAWGYA